MTGIANLGITPIAESQNQKYLTANNAIGRLADAVSETLLVSLASANVTLTSDQWRANLQFRATSATVAGRTITVPQNARLVLLSVDAATCAQSVAFLRGTASVTLAPGQAALVHQDGTANMLRSLIGGGQQGTLTGLSDVSGPFATGDLLRFDGSHFVGLAGTFLQSRPLTPFKGALVNRSTTQAIPATTTTAIVFDAEVYDVGGFWIPGAPSRLTVPAGVTRVRLWGCWQYTGGEANAFLSITKNGVDFPGRPRMSAEAGFSDQHLVVQSAVLAVLPGDYFELTAYLSTGRTIAANTAQFGIEVVETSDAAAATFIGALTDTPASYAGAAGKPLRVNGAGTAVEFAPRHNLSATTAPTASEDSSAGYGVGSQWLDTAGDKIWFCVDATSGAAVWKGVAIT